MVVTLKDSTINKTQTDTAHRILTVFPQVISQFEVNHKMALKHYLTAKGYTLTETENSVTGTKKGISITGQFDNLSRLTNLQG